MLKSFSNWLYVIIYMYHILTDQRQVVPTVCYKATPSWFIVSHFIDQKKAWGRAVHYSLFITQKHADIVPRPFFLQLNARAGNEAIAS